jgi:hypothetical protein
MLKSHDAIQSATKWEAASNGFMWKLDQLAAIKLSHEAITRGYLKRPRLNRTVLPRP